MTFVLMFKLLESKELVIVYIIIIGSIFPLVLDSFYSFFLSTVFN